VFYQQMMEAERAQALAEELVQAQQTAESDALLNAVMAETQRGDYTPGSIEELLEYLERTA
jgi:predicted RNA-binding protein associated with RNAse of E/G family